MVEEYSQFLCDDERDRVAAVFRCRSASFSDLVKSARLSPSEDFRGANLAGVDFRGSDLRGFDFAGANLAETSWLGAVWDSTTNFAGAEFLGARGFRAERLEDRSGAFLGRVDRNLRVVVIGVGGAGGNTINYMINSGLSGPEFIAANTDAEALKSSKASMRIQMGVRRTEGLGAGSQPDIGADAAREAIDEIRDALRDTSVLFVVAGMGGGTGTGAAPIIAEAAREMGILTIGVITKPFHFEGARRMRTAESGITELRKVVDTLLIIPNQNLFRVANERVTFVDAFAMADQVLCSGVACITDLMVKEGLINLDFADVRAVMSEMGNAMMGTGEGSGEKRALIAAEAAITSPLIDRSSVKGARGLLISITGGNDLTLFEVDEAATRIREEVDQDANIIVGATVQVALEDNIRVAVVATGIESPRPPRNSEDSAVSFRGTGRLPLKTVRRPMHGSVPSSELPSSVEGMEVGTFGPPQFGNTSGTELLQSASEVTPGSRETPEPRNEANSVSPIDR
ncbi:cell division protein FtsZ [Rhodopseudomonas palustris HaA2]|uniref:Cell division protein FtsZ n=1 Tax=Rhodopseudomonas palustris (strain HaA2) TaxID=316058 RepID=Q2IY32_RHOP2|nr:cell division protein FtsZ [Rhodopseudomonas palustris HaA2]